jgi:POT family proton-dependent oligopeptide transporter
MLFFTEMWERFSFYGMRSLLTLYMTLQLFEDLADPDKKAKAFGIYAAYGALVYATPYVGGILADRIIGYKKSTIWGGILMMIGHFVMAIENEFFLYVALAFLIMGNGFFKPNISSMVGGLYGKNDPRRDGGFTIFYMGINLGAFLAPLICGYVGETYGWFYGFGLAGIGMGLGLLNFLRGQKTLGHVGDPPGAPSVAPENSQLDASLLQGTPDDNAPIKQKTLGIKVEYLIYLASIVAVVLFSVAIRYYHAVELAIPFITLGVMGFVLVQSLFVINDKIEKNRLWVILVLTTVNIFFWAFFEQAGSSLTLFTKSNVDRTLLGFTIPASVFQSVNPAFILILAPLFASLWIRLSRIGREPSTPMKFVWGMVLLGLGFLALDFSTAFVTVAAGAALVPLIFLVFSYFLQTSGELALSPVGLSMVTKLSPQRMVAQLMGLWFLSTAFSHTIAGQIAKLTAGETDETLKTALVTAYDNKEVTDEQYAVIESWGGPKVAQLLENHLEAGHLTKQQVVTMASGDRYELREVLQPQVLQFKIAQEKMQVDAAAQQEKAFVPIELDPVDTKALAQLREETLSGDNQFNIPIEWVDRIQQNDLKPEVAGQDKIQVIAEAGPLEVEEIAVLTEPVRRAGQIALDEGVIDQQQMETLSASALHSYDGLANYSSVYRLVGFIAIGAGVVLLLLLKPLRAWMHGIH